jgi:anti-anti-sigma regulatory factor
MEAASAPQLLNQVRWAGECCIGSVTERLPELLAVARSQGPVEFDAHGISRIDTAGLQLVAAFAIELSRQGRTLIFSNPSEAFVKAAALAGLSRALGLDLASPLGA